MRVPPFQSTAALCRTLDLHEALAKRGTPPPPPRRRPRPETDPSKMERPEKCRGCKRYFDGKWTMLCPHCKFVNLSAAARGHYGNRRFAGSERESIAEGFHPAEYERACRIFGDIDGVQLVKEDDGVTVYFDHREAQREFVKRRIALEEAHPEVDDGPEVIVQDHEGEPPAEE